MATQQTSAQTSTNTPADKTSAKPIDSDFFNNMFGEGEFSTDFDDSGELQLTIADPQESETPNETDTEVAPNSVSETKTEDSEKSPNVFEQRINSLESSLNQVLEAIATKIIPALNGRQQQIQEQEPEEDFDITDTRSLTKLIESTVEKSLSKIIAPLQQTQQKTEKYMEASETFNKYGADFTEKVPVIRELMTVDTSLSFENAYLLAKKLEGHFKTQPANGSNGNSQTTTSQATKPASVLRERAEKLQTVNGVNPTGQVKPTKYETVEAAFEAAMAENFGRG